MKKRILIIEDVDKDFENMLNAFEGYQVNIYPNNRESFIKFSNNLSKFARTKSQETLSKIKEEIINFKPDIILMDLGLDYSNSSDESGQVIVDALLNEGIEPIPEIIPVSSHKPPGRNPWIRKKSASSLKLQIKNIIITKYQIEKDITNDTEINKEGSKKNKLHEKCGDYEEETIRPWARFILDTFITYLFYILLLILFTAAPIYIIYRIIKSDNLFQIAEHAFIAFLPFLIVFGFFIFYNRSLKSYILGEYVGPESDNYEQSSDLMSLTKKLFVSSLLSYLFIKLIELFYFEEPSISTSYFQDYYNTETPLTQLVYLIVFIIILMVYYLLLRRKNNKT